MSNRPGVLSEVRSVPMPERGPTAGAKRASFDSGHVGVFPGVNTALIPIGGEMRYWLLVPLIVMVVGCGPASPGGGTSARQPGSPASSTTAQRPLVVASSFEPPTLEGTFGSGAGTGDFGSLVNGFLAYIDSPYKPVPYLAESLPSLESGTWRLMPDGRMETDYRLRPNLTFHDGAPITTADFAFAFDVRSNPNVPVPQSDAEAYVAAVRVVDERTMVIEWERAYIWAAQINGPSFSPMPRHLLEQVYRDDVNAFVNGAHWREAFVGSGPYRLDSWELGAQMVFRAHGGFALGKPAIDQITVRFISDANVIVANLLSGDIDMAFNPSIAYPHGEILQQNHWPGKVEFFLGSPRYLHFQMRDWGNTQRAVHDVRVRRALLHAVDRESIAETIYAGHAPALHVWLYPADPSFAAVDRAIPKYSYDLNRSQALLQEAGWRRGGDGTVRNGVGEGLNLHVLAHSGRVEEQETEVIGASWRSLGLPVELSWLTPAQMRDGEYRSRFPAVTYDRRSIGYENMVWTSDNISSPENRWRLQNRNGYANPRLDDLWAKVMTTVAFPERERSLIEAMTVMAEDAAVIPTHLQPRTFAFPAGLVGIKPPPTPAGSITNSWEWRWQ